MSIPQYEATPRAALIRRDPQDQRRHLARGITSDGVGVAVLTAAIAVVPAVFWASLVWIVWGTLAAIVVMISVLAVSVLTMGLLRSAAEIETPVRRPGLRQAA